MEPSLRQFEIRGVLGRGGTGVVYEAFDTRSRALVALKAIDTSVAEDLYRLKHEFRAVAHVQHPNVVRFGELVCEDSQWFFTMELVRGQDFIRYVRPHAEEAEPAHSELRSVDETLRRLCPPSFQESGVLEIQPAEPEGPEGGCFDEARLRGALAQLVDALAALHEAGHVHCDVKPSNVLVSEQGRVVLLDFGLVTALAARESAAGDGAFVGTPAYMAPEQMQGLPAGPAADWYAVGVMLYRALTGTLPFSGSLQDMIAGKLLRDPPPPHERAPGLPPDLSALCQELMAREPERRPPVAVIRARLGVSPGAGRPLGDGGLFVGRERELERLQRALALVARGQARAVLVAGEPGVGKSALVRRFLAGLSPSTVVLQGRCYEQETVPFPGVDSIVDALSEHLLARSELERAELLAGGVRYLAAVFPVLERIPSVAAITAQGRSVENESVLREQALGELARVGAALGRRAPLVVFLDDLQWVDANSLALLERTLLPGSGTPCLFLATLRSGVEVPTGMARLAACAERVSLSGLADPEARELWDALSAGGRGGEERERALSEAAGHPLFLTELVRSARAGQLERLAGARLPEVLWDRISRRDPADRRFLEAVAVAGAPTPYGVLARAAELDLGDCQTRLGSLQAAQLVRVSHLGEDRCVEPYHDRIREAIVARLREQGRVPALHLRLGLALLDATPPAALPGRVFAITHHLHAGLELASTPAERLRLAELDLLASREARLATAYDRAGDHARLGLELLGDDGWGRAYALCRDLHLACVEAEHLLGQRDAARAVFDQARAHISRPSDLAVLYETWIALETGQGRYREAIEAGREVLAVLGTPLPRRVTKVDVVAEYARTRWAQGRRTIADLERLPLLQDPKTRSVLEILVALGPPAYLDGDLLAWMLLRMAGLSLREGVCDVSSYGFASYGMVISTELGQHEDGAALGRLALWLDQRFPNPHLKPKLRFLNAAFLMPWVRPFAEVDAALREAYALALEHGDTSYEAYTASLIATVELCRGRDLATLQETAQSMGEACARRGIDDMAGVAAAVARHAARLRGEDPDPAGDADLASPGETMPTTRFYHHLTGGERAYLCGDVQSARDHVAEATRYAHAVYADPSTAALCFLGALVSARAFDRAPAVERARLLVDVGLQARRLEGWARSCPANFEPHAALVRAELARISGRTRHATRGFDAAIASARQQGSPQREALALELATVHARSRGDGALARQLRREAVDAYCRWGAILKAEALEATPV